MKTSNFLRLDWRDLVKGLLMAILTPSVVVIQQSLDLGVLTFDLKSIGLAALSGGLAYLVKNLLTSAKEVSTIIGGESKIIGGRPDER